MKILFLVELLNGFEELGFNLKNKLGCCGDWPECVSL